VGKPISVDGGSGIYRSEFGTDGTETENESALADLKANDQLSPRVGVVAGNALFTWRTDAASKNTFDLFEARVDSVGKQGNALILADVQALGPAIPDAPGAVLYPYVKGGQVGLARLGLTCDKGLYDCTGLTPGVCVDTDLYLDLVYGCLDGTCTSVCP
jgi:hypothetical protein